MIVPFAAAAFAAACGSSPGSGTVGADVEPDVIEVDATDAIDALDLGSPDLEGPEVGDGSGDGDAGELAGYAEPCADDDECESGLCVELVDSGGADGFCSQPCATDETCPPGSECVFVAGTDADVERVCFPSDLCIDRDLDGFGVGLACRGPDCDDLDGNTNPFAAEICDGVDNDCDEQIDDTPVGTGDACATGFPGVCAEGRLRCVDGNPTCVVENPSTPEVCDGRDNDCDGLTDEDIDGFPLSRDCYDGPIERVGVGQCSAGAQTCVGGGYTGCTGQVLPAAEVCDGVDNDCDGLDDDGLATLTWLPDTDGDGFGDPAGPAFDACGVPDDAATAGGDCDDTSDLSYPVAPELCDGADNDCDDDIDEGAGCFDDGAGCDDGTDCASGVCRRGVCIPESSCAGGRCPDRVVLGGSGGGLRRGPAHERDPLGSPQRSPRPARELRGRGDRSRGPGLSRAGYRLIIFLCRPACSMSKNSDTHT